jgi:HEAT repeat protein
MITLSKELIATLESDCGHDLEEIIRARRRRDFEALQSLLSFDPSVKAAHRRNALYALGRWGVPTVVPAIRRLLPLLDEMELVSAVDALGRLGTPEALEGIVEHVDHPSPHVRKFAAHALGRIHSTKARSQLRKMADHDTVNYIRELASKILRNEEAQ